MKFIPVTKDHYDKIIGLINSPEELYLVYPNGRYPLDYQQLDYLSENRTELTVCISNNELIAFANLYKVTKNESAFIGNVVVSNNHRGKGIGKAITNYMAELCRKKYKAIPKLSVFAFNTRALLLYTKLGFTPYEIEQRKNLNGELVALIHMQNIQT